MNGSVCISPGWATIGPLKNHIFQMHCKTDAVNQVSLKRSMKCEGLPPGRCAVLVQTRSSLEARVAVPGWAQHSRSAPTFPHPDALLGPRGAAGLHQHFQSCPASIPQRRAPGGFPPARAPLLQKPQHLVKRKVQIHPQSYQNSRWQVPARVCCFFGKNQEKVLIPSVLSY